MKTLTYIRYFLYLGWNWNWRIALYVIRQEIKGEKKYGITTTGADELEKVAASGVDISHATVYMPITYFQLQEIFAVLPAVSRNHFLDIGCGKGRALCVAAHNGFPKVTGIDFAEKFCEESRQNLELTAGMVPNLEYKILNNDAGDTEIPKDVDCIFMFNPFDIVVMRKILVNVTATMLKNNRTIHIVYANPLYKDVFLKRGFKEVHYSKQRNYLELSIMSNGHR